MVEKSVSELWKRRKMNTQMNTHTLTHNAALWIWYIHYYCVVLTIFNYCFDVINKFSTAEWKLYFYKQFCFLFENRRLGNVKYSMAWAVSYNKRFFVPSHDNMIGYYSYAIVALFLSYFYSTIPASVFDDDRRKIEGHLRKERTCEFQLHKSS